MRRILIMCGTIAILFTQAAEAQNNNQSISDDLKKVWGGDQGTGSGTWLNKDGMNDTQAATEDITEIGFADDVSSTPIDGGISILLAAGLVAGAHRIRREVSKSKYKVNHPSK